MEPNRLTLGVCAFVFVLLSGCGAGPDVSDLKWGHLDEATGGDKTKWFINILPNEFIEICGTDDPVYQTQNAFKKWATVLQRVNFITVKPCSQDSTAKWKIIVSQGSWSMSWPGTGQVQMGGGGSGPPFAMLHEMGHLWGMCDQYINNCDPNHSGPWDQSSVMGSAADMELKSDDIAGIKALADRTDFPANATWKEFLAHQ